MKNYQNSHFECISGNDYYASYANFNTDFTRLVYFASTEPIFHSTCFELKEVNFDNPFLNKIIIPIIE